MSDAENEATRRDLLSLIKLILQERGLYELRRTKSELGFSTLKRERTKSDPQSANYGKKTNAIDTLLTNIDFVRQEIPIHLDILTENVILERWNFNIQL